MALRLIPIAAACVLLAAVSRFYDPANGFTELIGFGARFSARTVPAIAAVPRHITPGAGYDGQFYAQMATDPLLRDAATDRAMDLAPLRARRILFSWTAWVLGLGRPAWILQAYALQNVLAWLLLGWLLCRWFPPSRRAYGRAVAGHDVQQQPDLVRGIMPARWPQPGADDGWRRGRGDGATLDGRWRVRDRRAGARDQRAGHHYSPAGHDALASVGGDLRSRRW